MKRATHVRMILLTAAALSALAVFGCGGAKSKPHGKVLMNGEPYKVDSRETLRITFVSGGEAGKQFSTVAQVNPDGTFTVPGPTDEGVPPGKYHITVSTMMTGGPGGTFSPAGSAAPTGGDQFHGKYSATTTTPLTCEITSANPEIVIDVGKGTVSTGG